jgi:uncharacterized protein (TIGR01319 family)
MSKQVDILTIEVGSTITKVNGFTFLPEGGFKHIARGYAKTSIDRNDVSIGVSEAVADLESAYGARLENPETFVNSSAAGGLRMTVHGLTYNMTSRAAHEASLGAGAIVKKVTAGELESYDLQEIESINPNIILLAGGVDYGEKDIIIANAKKLASLKLDAPLVYAGNAAIQRPIRDIFHDAGIEVIIVENVFPAVDVFNVDPLRHTVQEVFNRMIIHAPGMEKFEGLSRWGILPTPGAVLKGAEIFAEALGDCLVFDVGGATTDVHSVTEGSPEYKMKLIEPEPRSKRSVEGDLGVFVNAANIVHLSREPEMEKRMGDLSAIPHSEREKELTRWLCARAVETGVKRHAGSLGEIYTATGKRQIVKGKDLTAVRWLVATGGALTRVEGAAECLKSICTGTGKFLLPPENTSILVDRNYLFSALGTIAQAYPADVKLTFQRWVADEKESREEKI